jgi:hypothetical protein
MKKIITSFVFIFAIILTSCNEKKSYIYSPDKKQCVTIITKNKIRYIIAGKHNSIPEKNYVKLDVSDRFKFADNIVGCWKNDKYRWQIINDGTVILDNRLDSANYIFHEKLPKDTSGIPSTTIFRNEPSFFYIGFDYGVIYDSYGVTIE